MNNETFGKFNMFERMLSSVSHNWLMQEALRQSTTEDLKQVLEGATIDDLSRYLDISIKKAQFDLCIKLMEIIKEKQEVPALQLAA